MDIKKILSKISDSLDELEAGYVLLEEEEVNLHEKIDDLGSENNDLNYQINYHMISQDDHNNVVAEYEKRIKTLEQEIADVRDTLEFVLLNKKKTTEV